jgi:hypothetical protein
MCSSTQLLACHQMVLPIDHHPQHCKSMNKHKHQTPAGCHPTKANIRSIYARQRAAHPCTHQYDLAQTALHCNSHVHNTQHGNLQILTALPFDKTKAENSSTTSRT